MDSLATRGPRAKCSWKYVFPLSGERKSTWYSEPYWPKCRFSLGGERKSTGYSEPYWSKCRFSLSGERKSTGTTKILKRKKLIFLFLKRIQYRYFCVPRLGKTYISGSTALNTKYFSFPRSRKIHISNNLWPWDPAWPKNPWRGAPRQHPGRLWRPRRSMEPRGSLLFLN